MTKASQATVAPATSESIPAHDPLDDQPILQIGDFPPTSEQAAVIRAGVYTKDNLLINAYAGAAKKIGRAHV